MEKIIYLVGDNGYLKTFLDEEEFFDLKEKDALKESIRKWEWFYDYLQRHAPELIEDIEIYPALSMESCALCHFYFYSECKGCPVSEKTGEIGCEKSPFELVDELIDNLNTGDIPKNKIQHTRLLKLVGKEIAFLKSLEKKHA